jgi:hypothetical protein
MKTDSSKLLGPLTPFLQDLGTGYQQFESDCGVGGLAKINGDRLDLLAFRARQPGSGQFREFIRRAKEEFSVICIWEIWNPEVEPMLQRYGFKPGETDTDSDGSTMTGWRWQK